jgi:hypothetical protein
MATHSKHVSNWNHWMEWHKRGGSTNTHLQELTRVEKVRTCCGFMHAVRRGDFSRKGYGQVASTTARAAVDHVVATIINGGGEDPRVDGSGKISNLLLRQQRAYKKLDPATQHQKALPPEVYRYILPRANTPRSRARAELLCSALFFACRSCEYTGTQRSEKQRTRPIRACDVTFRQGNRIIPHSHPLIHLADTVTIVFGYQKTDVREESVTQEATNDLELNPVTHWAYTIRRLRSYDSYDPDWPVHTYFNGDKFTYISSTEFLIEIRAAVDAIGFEVLGFYSHEVGTHSNRAACAMMMYLAGVPTFTIMLIGRWASDAFLSYIEKQVLSFSKGVSRKMLFSDTFYNVPVKPPPPTKDKDRSRSINWYLPSARLQIHARH